MRTFVRSQVTAKRTVRVCRDVHKSLYGFEVELKFFSFYLFIFESYNKASNLKGKGLKLYCNFYIITNSYITLDFKSIQTLIVLFGHLWSGHAQTATRVERTVLRV